VLLAYIATLGGFPVFTGGSGENSTGTVAACGCSLEKREAGTCCCRPATSALPSCCAARSASAESRAAKLSSGSSLVKSVENVVPVRKTEPKPAGGWVIVMEAMKCRGESGFWFLSLDSAVPPLTPCEWQLQESAAVRFLPPACGSPLWIHAIPELPG